jgi:hypothetical protein
MPEFSFHNAHRQRTLASLLAVPIFVVAWFVCTIAQMEKYPGVTWRYKFTALGAVCLASLMLFLRGLYPPGAGSPSLDALGCFGLAVPVASR